MLSSASSQRAEYESRREMKNSVALQLQNRKQMKKVAKGYLCEEEKCANMSMSFRCLCCENVTTEYNQSRSHRSGDLEPIYLKDHCVARRTIYYRREVMSDNTSSKREHSEGAYLSGPLRNLLCLGTSQLCPSRLQDFCHPRRAQRFLQLSIRESFS